MQVQDQRRQCICMYTPSSDGGHALYTRELLDALAAHCGHRYRFELVTSEDLHPQFRSSRYVVHEILPPLTHREQFATRLTWAASRLTHYSRRERKFLKWLRGRPDIVAVHIQEWTPWLAARMVQRIRATGKRVFYTVHNVQPHRYPAAVPKTLVHHWIRKSCLRTDGLFVHTTQLAEQLSRFLCGAHPPIHVSPHGVWSVRADPEPPPLQERLARKKLLFFGAIRRNKGLHVLLDAADRLPGYSITVAGAPRDPAYFRGEILPRISRLREAGLKVDLLDQFIPEEKIGQLFLSHSAIVLPYTSEFVAQSGVVFMALAFGLPVVASNAGGLRELLGEFRIGRSFDQDSPGSLAQAVQQLHNSDSRGIADLLEQLHAARQRYSWQEAARATSNAYAAVLASGAVHNDSPVPVIACS